MVSTQPVCVCVCLCAHSQLIPLGSMTLCIQILNFSSPNEQMYYLRFQRSSVIIIIPYYEYHTLISVFRERRYNL